MKMPSSSGFKMDLYENPIQYILSAWEYQLFPNRFALKWCISLNHFFPFHLRATYMKPYDAHFFQPIHDHEACYHLVEVG